MKINLLKFDIKSINNNSTKLVSLGIPRGLHRDHLAHHVGKTITYFLNYSLLIFVLNIHLYHLADVGALALDVQLIRYIQTSNGPTSIQEITLINQEDVRTL